MDIFGMGLAALQILLCGLVVWIVTRAPKKE